MTSLPTNTQKIRDKLASLRRDLELLERDTEGLDQPQEAGTGRPALELEPLRDGLRQILAAGSAPAALNLLLSQSIRYADRAVLFLLRKGTLWAWSGMNSEGARIALTNLTLRPEESPLLATALRQQQSRHTQAPEVWEQQLGAPSSGAVALPIPGPERSGGVLWLDPGDGLTQGAIEAVECLVATTGAALELIALRRAPGLPAGGRLTSDERVLESQLPYSVAEEAGASAEAELPEAPDPSLASQHEDARRLARLLVSEIKLYNEDKVVLGRKTLDLYQRLRDDIERSRQAYEDRVSPDVLDASDYFQQEIVRTLAEGNRSLLGPIPSESS